MNGARALTTNTFRTNKRCLAKVGLSHLYEHVTRKAVQMACEARDEVNPEALVLGCVAPLESCYDHKQAPDSETCKKEHRANMKLLLDSGCDFILLET